MAKIVVDLHDCFNNGTKMDAALNNAIDESGFYRNKTGGNNSRKGKRSAKEIGAAIFRAETYQATISPYRKRF